MTLARNRLFPSFVVVDYTSAHGQHKQTLPTLQWNGSGLGDPGSFDTHDGTGIVSTTMMLNFINAYRPVLPTTTQLVSYTIYNMPTPTSIPQPVYGAAIGLAGTDATTTGQAKAVQWTMTIRTTVFGLLKFVMLDRPSGNIWGNVTAMDAPTLALFNQLTASENGWSGRGGGRPLTFLGISISLNKALRRKYDMI